jgi:hypothetical protein
MASTTNNKKVTEVVPQQAKPSREELVKRLRAKRAELRGEGKVAVSQKEYNKMVSGLNHELKKLNTDPRITPRMKELYERAVKTYDKLQIPSPLELLSHVEKATKKFHEFMTNMIATCKKNNIPREEFIDEYLNSLFSQYYVEVLGDDIVPENLRSMFKKMP